jgi:hypothetical protein
LDVDHKSQDYYYGPDGTDAPEYIPGHIFRSTNAPGYWSHYNDHGGIPNMLTPPQNPMLTGTVCVCGPGFVHPAPPPPGQTRTVGYSLSPAEMILDVWTGPPAVRLTIWDPANPTFARFWESSALSDSFQWDGWLYGSNGTDPQNASRLLASDYFMRAEWRVVDYYWNNSVQFYLHTLAMEEERVIFDVHAEGTDAPSQIREIAAGGVDNPAHRAIIGIYTNPPKLFSAIISMTGGVGIEPPIYQFLGQNFKLGHKVDAQLSIGGQTLTAGDPNPILLDAWGSFGGTLRSCNRVSSATINVALNNGLGSHQGNVEFAAPTIDLHLPDPLFPERPDTVTVTLSLPPPAPRLVPGHELLFYVNNITFKNGTHLDWLKDAYVRGYPELLDRFVQVRTGKNDPQYGVDITDISDCDGFSSATITIVEPLLGIDKVEVKLLDGSVYQESP